MFYFIFVVTFYFEGSFMSVGKLVPECTEHVNLN